MPCNEYVAEKIIIHKKQENLPLPPPQKNNLYYFVKNTVFTRIEFSTGTDFLAKFTFIILIMMTFIEFHIILAIPSALLAQ